MKPTFRKRDSESDTDEDDFFVERIRLENMELTYVFYIDLVV